MSLKLRTKSEIALIVATILWGLTFPFIRIVLKEITPLQLVFLRGLIAAFVFLPFVIFIKNNRNQVLKVFPIGALLGFLFFASYLTQSIGLQTISSGRSAFITNLSVIFVPLLSPLFKRGSPSRNDIFSCFIAICGIYFLSSPISKSTINVGDLWTLLTAVCFSFQIHTLQWAMEHKPNATNYAFWQVTFVMFFSSLFLPFSESPKIYLPHSLGAILALLYLAIVAMVFTTWLQSKYQCNTSPERATVIYIAEPLIASIFGYILLNETMSIINIFGGFLIIVAVLWNYIINFLKRIF